MPPERSAEQFDFGRVEGRIGEAAFDAGLESQRRSAFAVAALLVLHLATRQR